MIDLWAIALFVSVLLILLASGVWVGAALFGSALVGLALLSPRPLEAVALSIWGQQKSWALTALPLFVLMGEILFRSRLSEMLFRGLAPTMSRLPGGLLHVNIAASTVFAAVSGSSAATVATVGRMAIPELKRREYPERLILGTLAGAGTLGLLIPPSIAMIVYGFVVNISVAQLFIASIIPGLVLAGMFMAYVAILSFFSPQLRQASAEVADDRSGWDRFLDLAPVLVLIVAVIGSIYRGWATPTEAAALGVIGALFLAGMQKDPETGKRGLPAAAFGRALMGAVATSAMIMFILMGAEAVKLAMGFTGIPQALAAGVIELELTPAMLILVLTIFYVILGMFLDGISAIVLTMAVIQPTVEAAGIDMIWFGVYLMVVVEMAQITPPIGFNLFVLQGMTGRDIGFISRAAAPMFFVMCLFVVVLAAFPELATWLPEQTSGRPG